MARLNSLFFEQSTTELAKALLGCRFVHASESGVMSGLIVETEAYLSQDDHACHAAKGMTPRNRSMFGPPGCLYVYSIHNRYCMNIVTEKVGVAAAVLIRAIEPDNGIERMLQRRHVTQIRELTNGPGKLCQAMEITKAYDGTDLSKSERLWIEDRDSKMRFSVRTTTRIGISRAQDLLLRFFIDGNPYVSGRVSDHSVPLRTAGQSVLRGSKNCPVVPNRVARPTGEA